MDLQLLVGLAFLGLGFLGWLRIRRRDDDGGETSRLNYWLVGGTILAIAIGGGLIVTR